MKLFKIEYIYNIKNTTKNEDILLNNNIYINFFKKSFNHNNIYGYFLLKGKKKTTLIMFNSILKKIFSIIKRTEENPLFINKQTIWINIITRYISMYDLISNKIKKKKKKNIKATYTFKLKFTNRLLRIKKSMQWIFKYIFFYRYDTNLYHRLYYNIQHLFINLDANPLSKKKEFILNKVLKTQF